MRAVVQRVTRSTVNVDGEKIGAIGMGVMVLLAVGHDDERPQADWLVQKIANL